MRKVYQNPKSGREGNIVLPNNGPGNASPKTRKNVSLEKKVQKQGGDGYQPGE